MAELLTALRSTNRTDQDSPDFVIKEVEEKPSKNAEPIAVAITRNDVPGLVASNDPDGLLEVLKNEPDTSVFGAVLQRLVAAHDASALNLKIPGPTQAKITHVLVNTSIPTFWHSLLGVSRDALVQSLTSVTGINAILSRLQQLIRSSDKTASATRIGELLSVLNAILRPQNVLAKLWTSLNGAVKDKNKHVLAWREVINVFGSGRIISISAEAYESIRTDNLVRAEDVLSGSAYTVWLADNVIELTRIEDTTRQATHAASQMLAKGLSLGYQQVLVSNLITASIEKSELSRVTALVSLLPASTKRRFIETALAWLSASFPSGIEQSDTSSLAPVVAGVLQIFVRADQGIRQQMSQIILEPPMSGALSLAARVAVIAVLAQELDFDFGYLVEKSLRIFGDQLFIDHAPIAQQDAIAQNIAVAASWLKSTAPSRLTNVLRSSHHMQAVSSRLACSSPRARWLGMIIGTVLSRLIDKEGSQMDFGTDDMNTSEANAWFNLIGFKLDIGTPGDLIKLLQTQPSQSRGKAHTQELPVINGKQTFGPPRPPELKQLEIDGDRVTEVTDTAIDLDDDLKPYAKPDDDPEDSDEDATLVNRDKAKPPVYIRTLMSMLRDTEKADRFQLAIKHSAPLIRRKTGFGREVTDHAEELARILTNLQDPFETEDFDHLRLQALIAIVLSDFTNIAPWLSRQVFIKDYSIAQRTIMLTALGLSGRELAGLKHEDKLNRAFENSQFPSKQLPDRLHAIYGQSMLLDAAAETVEQSIIQPLALAAADQTTSHLDAVKVRKFSSRMDIERTRRKPAANSLAKILHKAFFYPLVSFFQQDMINQGDASAFSSTPLVLTTFLKTLALLLHASGPATIELDSIVIDFWELLLSLRAKAISDINIMETLLFCLLTMLEAKTNHQDLVRTSPWQLMETKEWCEMVFERTGGGNLIEGQGEEARVRMLCAGLLTKLNDIISQYQDALMGSWKG